MGPWPCARIDAYYECAQRPARAALVGDNRHLLIPFVHGNESQAGPGGVVAAHAQADVRRSANLPIDASGLTGANRHRGGGERVKLLSVEGGLVHR